MKLYVNPNNGTVDDTFGASIITLPNGPIPDDIETPEEILAWANEIGLDIQPV